VNAEPVVTYCFYFILTILVLFSTGTTPFLYAGEAPFIDELVEGFEAKNVDTGEDGKENKTDALDSVMDGFDEDTEEIKEPEEIEDEKPSRFSFDGYLKQGLSYNFAHDRPEPGVTDWRGLSRFRSDINLELKAKLSDTWKAQVEVNAYYDFVFAMRGRDEYTEEVLDNREKDAEFGESYLMGSITDKLDIRFGRQIMVWGKSDNIRITDIINPLDLREPGLVDIEDLRLPVTMTRLDYYLGNWNLSGLFIHEIRFNKVPAFGSDFFPGTSPLPPEDAPSNSLNNTEFAAAINGILSGWDVAFYFSDVYNKQPYQEIKPDGQLVRKYARVKMIGSAFNMAFGNWLLKSEAAYLDGIKFFNAPGKSFSRIDALVGFEYTGFHETVISIEVANRHLFDFEDALKQAPDKAVEDEFQTAFRFNRAFLNDTLTVIFLAQTFGVFGDGGAFQRISAEYDLTDSIQLSGGFVFYTSGDLRQFHDVGDNDRLFLGFKYSF
jgi:hypothetical protein